MTDDLSGRTLGDRYDVLELVGAGGMGTVYRARDRELDEVVALKVIRAELADDPRVVDRFRAEVKLARRVTHKNVARTFELGRDGAILWATMELVDGEPLARRIARGPLPTAEAVAIACAMCDGLAAAHAVGIVHRDIKPDNVLVARDGRVVLADFGVAALAVAASDGSGTPAYMAPEQARGEPATPSVDVYAVGVVLYEMLVGKRPDARDAERHVPRGDHVAAELAEVVGRATARDVAARVATAEVLRRALSPFAASAVAPAAPRVVGNAGIKTVVVIAPRGDGERCYLAAAVHGELLTRLARRPRLRVRPAASTAIADAIVVELVVGDELVATIRDVGGTRTLALPLAVDHVGADAETIAGAVAAAAVAAAREPSDAARAEAHDLLLRARHSARIDRFFAEQGLERLERAFELAPDDPGVMAGLAIARLRVVFIQPTATFAELTAAAALARAALAAGPDLAEAHIASGQIALHCADPVAAAGHFRRAITCAPLSVEAHEYLGLMLLEAGHIDVARARLDEAVAIEPKRMSVKWEIARALALEARWDDHDRLVSEIDVDRTQRILARARYAAWRGEPARVAALIAEVSQSFEPQFVGPLFDVYTSNGWARHRAHLLERSRAPVPDSRRRTFVAQIIAEAAGFAHDVDACNAIIAYATEEGLFDLHWMDRCPLLADARPTEAFARQRRRIKERADAILDALYGDHVVESSQTTLLASRGA
jgi:serine/threonine-protein kinase